jgi:hypothetical protein
MSATHSWLGRVAVKSRPTRSAGLGLRIGYRGSLGLATHHALQAELAHQPLDGAAGDLDTLPLELPPHLAGAVHLEVLLPDALDLGLELGVALLTRRGSVLLVGVVGAGGTSRTRQIGSTPKRPRRLSIIRVTSSGDGRARPRKTRSPP